MLFRSIPDGEDLHIISEDGDYFSKLDSEQPNRYLSEEWALTKHSCLYIWRRISGFLTKHFPQAKLASELEKELLISDLASSGNFARTHSIIARLQGYDQFTTTQSNDLIEAIVSNNQVAWIITDQDVAEFAKWVLKTYGKLADSEKVELLQKLIPQEEPDVEI